MHIKCWLVAAAFHYKNNISQSAPIYVQSCEWASLVVCSTGAWDTSESETWSVREQPGRSSPELAHCGGTRGLPHSSTQEYQCTSSMGGERGGRGGREGSDIILSLKMLARETYHREEIDDDIGVLPDDHVCLHCSVFKSLEHFRVLQVRKLVF